MPEDKDKMEQLLLGLTKKLEAAFTEHAGQPSELLATTLCQQLGVCLPRKHSHASLNFLSWTLVHEPPLTVTLTGSLWLDCLTNISVLVTHSTPGERDDKGRAWYATSAWEWRMTDAHMLRLWQKAFELVAPHAIITTDKKG